ncbi:MAG: NifB/NifX family molybdenum-iron cluster-binding protein [Desulfobacterales bacterium]|nr:NifB/NifX family molybdenum-iron cluster-binding protein [Desulfobacterales bacterium]MBF0398896.1 NifB/NifX family molybdenum-iron cluster-binding protein [Desulfobacterales bacterium]
MILAVAVGNNRISPVFDVAKKILVLEIEKGAIVRENIEVFSCDNSSYKITKLIELKVHTLICGAISRQLLNMITMNGIEIIPFIAGEVKEVISAYLEGGLSISIFSMPGCSKRQNKECKKRRNF